MCVEDAALTTDTPAIACLYEQEGADLEVSVEAVIDGVRRTLEGAAAPNDRTQPDLYGNPPQGVVDTELRLTVEAWGDGGESPLQPDLAGRLTVDAGRSEFPADVRITGDGAALELPYAATELLLAVHSDMELELEPSRSRC